MQVDSPLATRLLIIGAIGLVTAANITILGLVAIAVVHDGTSATDIATTLQTVLVDAITAMGTLAGSLITGRAVHNAMLQSRQSQP